MREELLIVRKFETSSCSDQNCPCFLSSIKFNSEEKCTPVSSTLSVLKDVLLHELNIFKTIQEILQAKPHTSKLVNRIEANVFFLINLIILL